MTTVLTPNLLVNGLRAEFADTYTKVRNRQSDSRIAQLMEMSINATNRQHEFGYIEAGPHAEIWRRGDPIPEDAMGSVKFTATVHNFGRRVKWHKDDRADDQLQILMDGARMAGESFALLPERIFFDLLQSRTDTLPGVPLAPDGAAFFATTAGGAARFGATGGNSLTGTGVASSSAILADYYSAIEQFMLFQDGKGQPLLSPDAIAAGAIIIFGAGNLSAFEPAFLQQRQGVVYGSNSAAAGVSNIIQDAARNVELMPTPRITTNDWYVFLKNPPKKPTFHLTRQAVEEKTSLSGDNNSDLTRTTGIEYIQWDSREGGGIALPYGAIRIDN